MALVVAIHVQRYQPRQDFPPEYIAAVHVRVGATERDVEHFAYHPAATSGVRHEDGSAVIYFPTLRAAQEAIAELRGTSVQGSVQ